MNSADKFHFMIVGDVHGHYQEYLETIQLANYSLQLGDLGFNYEPLVKSGKWDPNTHKFLPGNHDNYSIKEVFDIDPLSAKVLDPYSKYVVVDGKVYTYTRLPNNFIGNYGVWQVPKTLPEGKNGDSIFFVRGAWSIDFAYRTVGLDIWDNEELTQDELERALKMYAEVKPSFVVTHTCPQLFERHLELTGGYGRLIKTRTGLALQQMFDIHKPKLWVFGHHHQELDKVIDGCRFVCLPELGFLCFDEKLDVISST
jgi:hypothetical protein